MAREALGTRKLFKEQNIINNTKRPFVCELSVGNDSTPLGNKKSMSLIYGINNCL